MYRCALMIACVLAGSVAVAEEKPLKPAGDRPVAVYMELCQVEVDVLKLRRMGVDWKTLSEHETVTGNPAWLRKQAELMRENDLARVNAEPRLTTIAGRKAVFDIATTRATLLPRMAEEKIAVEVTLETFDPPANEKGEISADSRGEPKTSLTTKTACRPGQTVLLGQELSTKKNSAGEVTAETATLTFLMADTKMSELEHAGVGKHPRLRPTDGPVLVGERPLGNVVEVPRDGAAVKPRAATGPRNR